MNTRSNDQRRGRSAGNQGFGHDPRRGASSPQWNREGQMQHEQFMPRHGSQQGGFEGGYGGYGGHEESYGRGDESLRGDWRSERYDDRDFDTAYGQSGPYGQYGQRRFGGYGDYDQEFERSQRSHPGSHASRGNLPWMHRGQEADELGRDEHLRSAWGQQMRHYDPDYEQWRREQLQRLDDDYDEWRRERYGKFADEFNTWRANRAGRASSSSSSPSPTSQQRGSEGRSGTAGSTGGSSGGSGSKQQG